ncbi:MAG: HAD family hydrolase [Pseudomonadota bacterium]
MNIAVFMDRDGTVSEEVGYLSDPDGVNILPGAVDAIRLINKHRIKAVVVTNQSGVARGYFSEETVERIHRRLKELLKEQGAYLDGIYYCPHHGEYGPPEYRKKCNCRKPSPGMLEQASRELRIDLFRSYVVGDKISDIEVAYSVGSKAILLLTGYGKDEVQSLKKGSQMQPHHIARDLFDAVNWILLDLRLK